jgi:preprotein translocase subunit SecE
MAKTNPVEFLKQVRSEVGKVTWPTRRETGITTVLVLVMAVASAIFFMVVDWLIRIGLSLLLALGS